MFCSKCGNSLPDDAKFCGVCGAPVKISQEASPVPQQPAGISDETENIQTPKPEPLMQEPNFNGQMGYGAAAPVQKKSKKGLIIGLSVGIAILLIAATAVVLVALGLFDPAPSSPFPVLKVEQTQIYYGEDLDQLEEAFPNIEKITEPIYSLEHYSLEQSGDQSVGCLVRADKERGETKLVQWITTMNNTGLANGISIGDSYEKISTKYPDAMCSTEIRPNNPSKYDPEIDASVYFPVYMDENGNTYSYAEYEQKRADSIREQGNFDLAKWYVHLYGFNENREFGEVYQYENNAFYMNQLPDGMEFTKCEETQFYTNTQFAYYDDFENIKEEMRESLQIDMVNMLNEMGIAAPENSSTQTNQSEFDITSMLGEWTLELILPDGSTVRRVIKLQADGTMTMRAEDGSWQDYTYVMDDTHFAYTYVGTGISSSGTYTISGDVITVYLEAEN